MTDLTFSQIQVSTKGESPFQVFLSLFRKNVPATLGVIVFFILLIVCLSAPILSSYDPHQQDLINALQKPSAEHLLGTDYLGRDLMT